MDQTSLYVVISMIILILASCFMKSKSKEKFDSFGTYDQYLFNRNSFGNYYRIGYEQSRNLGWKPSETWDHLRPENNECPQCYHKNPIFYY